MGPKNVTLNRAIYTFEYILKYVHFDCLVTFTHIYNKYTCIIIYKNNHMRKYNWELYFAFCSQRTVTSIYYISDNVEINYLFPRREAGRDLMNPDN